MTATREVRDGQLRHHSGRGSNYTAFRFWTSLADHGILASMGTVGDFYDASILWSLPVRV